MAPLGGDWACARGSLWRLLVWTMVVVPGARSRCGHEKSVGARVCDVCIIVGLSQNVLGVWLDDDMKTQYPINIV